MVARPTFAPARHGLSLLTAVLISACSNDLADPVVPFDPGPKPPEPWVFAENFDDGVLGSALTVWNADPAGQPPAIVLDGTALGGRSLQLTWTGGAEGDQGARIALPEGKQPAAYVRFRYKLPADANLTGPMTLVQFLGPEDQEIGSLNIAAGQWMHWGDVFTDGNGHFATGSTPADCLGKWCWVEASLDYSAETSVRARVWINGDEVLDYTRDDISYSGGIVAALVWGWYAAPAATRSEWVDELSVGTTHQDIPPAEPVAPEVYLSADFSNCSAKAQAGTLLPSSYGGDGDNVAVTHTNPYPGGQCSAEFTFGGNSDDTDDAWAEWRFRLNKPATEVWVAWSAYYPGPLDLLKGTAVYVHRNVSPNNNKLLRLWDEDYNAYRLKVGFSLTAAALSSIIPEYGTNRSGVGRFGAQFARDAITPTQLGRWIRFVAHAKAATAADNDGVIELWEDGQKVISNTALPMYPNGGLGNYFRNGYLLGWANSGFAATTKVWLAKVIIANTKALTDIP